MFLPFRCHLICSKQANKDQNKHRLSGELTSSSSAAAMVTTTEDAVEPAASQDVRKRHQSEFQVRSLSPRSCVAK